MNLKFLTLCQANCIGPLENQYNLVARAAKTLRPANYGLWSEGGSYLPIKAWGVDGWALFLLGNVKSALLILPKSEIK